MLVSFPPTHCFPLPFPFPFPSCIYIYLRSSTSTWTCFVAREAYVIFIVCVFTMRHGVEVTQHGLKDRQDTSIGLWPIF